MSGASFEEASAFEAEVRRAARALWDARPGDGAPDLVDGRERDCIIETEDLTHYVECTTSRTLEKLKKDGNKLKTYRDDRGKHGRLVACWFVTRDEPTAEQHSLGKMLKVTVISFAEFQKKLIDGQKYLQLRTSYPFGSAVDPRNDSVDLKEVRFVPTPIVDTRTAVTYTISQLAGELTAGAVSCMIGDFGVGKSLTFKHVFDELKRAFFRSNSSLVPIALNLRDHWGQSEPAEALVRHARHVGFEQPHQLVRAFNAGQCIVLLDGFDEIASISWSGRGNKRLRDLRANAVSLVARFVELARGKGGLLVCGREHFFDSHGELRNSLGLRSTDPLVQLIDFDDESARKYLTEVGIDFEVPDWLPRRPLLLATFAARGFLQDALSEEVEPARAWSSMIDKICEREAKIHKYLDASTIRNILERLASKARIMADGLGPLTEDDIGGAFRAETGAYPDETARPLLQRLPGLTARDRQTGSRAFLDDQLVDVLRAGDVARFLENPYVDPHASRWQNPLGELAVDAVRSRQDADESLVAHAVVAAREAAMRWNSPTLAGDLVALALRGGTTAQHVDFQGLKITGGDLSIVDLSGPSVSRLCLEDCQIDTVIVDRRDETSVAIEDCTVKSVLNVFSERDTPSWMGKCEIGEYDTLATTTNELLEQDRLPLGARVLLAVLRKLYIQKGHGRRENALFRGMHQNEQSKVAGVLAILQHEGLALPIVLRGNTIWHPVSRARARARQLLLEQDRSSDPAVAAAKRL